MPLPGLMSKTTLPVTGDGDVFRYLYGKLPDVTPRIPPREVLIPPGMHSAGTGGSLPGIPPKNALPSNYTETFDDISPEVKLAGAVDYVGVGTISALLLALYLLK